MSSPSKASRKKTLARKKTSSSDSNKKQTTSRGPNDLCWPNKTAFTPLASYELEYINKEEGSALVDSLVSKLEFAHNWSYDQQCARPWDRKASHAFFEGQLTHWLQEHTDQPFVKAFKEDVHRPLVKARLNTFLDKVEVAKELRALALQVAIKHTFTFLNDVSWSRQSNQYEIEYSVFPKNKSYDACRSGCERDNFVGLCDDAAKALILALGKHLYPEDSVVTSDPNSLCLRKNAEDHVVHHKGKKVMFWTYGTGKGYVFILFKDETETTGSDTPKDTSTSI